ncbi:MAG TPA: hypothetical protein ENH85_12255 [Candidatus Scalindua sp.]|nr:hypothetical protein [Candidatus Scalindua sp.]
MIKCKGCNAEIPPQWVAALNSGNCPGCGGEIFHNEEKKLLCELRDAMKQMETASAESIVGWLLSNYKLHKIGDAEPTEFHQLRHAQPQGPHDGIPANIKIADNPVHKFLQRTGYGKQLDNRKRLKDIVSEIDGNVSAPPTTALYNTDYDPVIDLDAEAPMESDYDDYDMPPQPVGVAKQVLANSVVMGGDGAPIGPEELRAMAAAVSMAGQAVPAEDNVHPALQQDRMIRLQKQRDVAHGGGQGSFRRI